MSEDVCETLVWTKFGAPSRSEPAKMSSLPRTTKYDSNKYLANNFLHCEFQLSMLCNSKVSFWEPFWRRASSGSDFREFDLQKTSKFSPNNCLTNNFLHYEFHLSMFSSSKILVWEGNFFESGVVAPPKFDPKNCLTNNFLHYEF